MSLFIATFADSTTEEIYAGTTAIDNYVTKKIGSGPDAYRALAPGSDARLRLMVEATRFIDAQAWQGTPDALGGTVLQFPRTGLVDSTGAAISDATQLAAVAKAVGELVAILADNDDPLSARDAGSNVRSLGAGSARIDYFRPTSTGDGNATLLPVPIMRILGKWLAIASAAVAAAAAGSASGGTDSRSDFDDCDDDGDRVRTVLWPL